MAKLVNPQEGKCLHAGGILSPLKVAQGLLGSPHAVASGDMVSPELRANPLLFFETEKLTFFGSWLSSTFHSLLSQVAGYPDSETGTVRWGLEPKLLKGWAGSVPQSCCPSPKMFGRAAFWSFVF